MIETEESGGLFLGHDAEFLLAQFTNGDGTGGYSLCVRFVSISFNWSTDFSTDFNQYQIFVFIAT